jgi:hypothetical protein
VCSRHNSEQLRSFTGKGTLLEHKSLNHLEEKNNRGAKLLSCPSRSHWQRLQLFFYASENGHAITRSFEPTVIVSSGLASILRSAAFQLVLHHRCGECRCDQPALELGRDGLGRLIQSASSDYCTPTHITPCSGDEQRTSTRP